MDPQIASIITSMFKETLKFLVWSPNWEIQLNLLRYFIYLIISSLYFLKK